MISAVTVSGGISSAEDVRALKPLQSLGLKAIVIGKALYDKRLTLEEALWAITAGGARALGLGDRGHLTVGERADFVVVDHRDWRALLYQPGAAPVWRVANATAAARRSFACS